MSFIDENGYYECPICKTKHSGEPLVDECPVCDWIYSYEKDEDAYDEVNHMTMRHARLNYAKGFDIWGAQLKKQG